MQQEISGALSSQRMRLAHLRKFADKMGIDGLAVCGNEADLTFYEEYNFDGLMNEPWYDRLTGKEMHSLFKKDKRLQGRSPPFKSSSTPSSLEGKNRQDSLSDLDQLKNEQPKRTKRKRFDSNVLSLDDQVSAAGRDLNQCKKKANGVANKDLLKYFQNSIARSEEDAKSILADVIDSDTTNSDAANKLKEHLYESFNHAQAEIRAGERPLRSLVRFGFDLMSQFLARLSKKEQLERTITFNNQTNVESTHTRKETVNPYYNLEYPSYSTDKSFSGIVVFNEAGSQR